MKTAINVEQLREIIDSIGLDPYSVSINRMSEGQESEAFLLSERGRALVLRINPRIDGFLKDKLAHERFSEPTLPIPRVLQVGWYDNHHAYCASELVPGFTVQDADLETLTRLAPLVDEVHTSLAESSNLGGGYGPFDATGNAAFGSWREYLENSISRLDWDFDCAELDQPLIQSAIDICGETFSSCPEIRHLVHADFGANNLLTDGRAITGVIDWDTALYGDPLYDVAIASVWSFHLKCMEVQRDFWKSKFRDSDNFNDRIQCYQLKILLEEISESGSEKRVDHLLVMQDRLRSTLDQQRRSEGLVQASADFGRGD